ncbi:hypothetical protein [Tumebacillus algifaecis]|uniref:hypothetical protein n=1 Tax=Tumebacillus algifaecis TaxID=1214604 RepID=UPI0012FE1405|nr:hypothetical protein [Tumebacillus algifaecis]
MTILGILNVENPRQGGINVKPFNAQTRKDGGKSDLIAFDNPDDMLENIPPQAQGYAETMVVVDNPDDFEEEGTEV